MMIGAGRAQIVWVCHPRTWIGFMRGSAAFFLLAEERVHIYRQGPALPRQRVCAE